MPPTTVVISHAIQLAIAPVFLLTGVAALLGVMATRLARVIDRARTFEASWPHLSADARAAALAEMRHLEPRRHVVSWSINCCTTAALLICLVIVALFVEEFFATNLRWLTGALFVGAMLLLIGGLACFLREVYLATHTTSIDPSRFEWVQGGAQSPFPAEHCGARQPSAHNAISSAFEAGSR